MSSLTYLGARTTRAYQWRHFQSTSDWVENNVKLSSEASPVVGKMQLKYTPHLREMFDDADKKGIELYVAMASTQVAKTTYELAITAKILDTKPSKMLYAIPNEKDVADYVDDKVLPFMRGVDSLVGKMNTFKDSEKVRDKKSRLRVAGGDVFFVGDTPSARRSKTVKYLMIDEIDLFGDNALVEFRNRQKAFEKFGAKCFVASSQKKERGEVIKAYEGCDIKKDWSTVCKECNHAWYAGSKDLRYTTKEQYSKLKNIHIEDINLFQYKQFAMKDVFLECPECGHHISNSEKEQQILDNKYKFININNTTTGKSIGYRMNALAMYFTTFEKIVSQLIDIENDGDFDDKRQFYVDMFNELLEQDLSDHVDKNDILLLSNSLQDKEIPEDTYKLYLTIDTQKNGFWYQVTAFAYGMRMHTVTYGFVETFDELELLMGYRFKDKNDKVYIVDKTLIDRMGIKERTVEVDFWIEKMIIENGMEHMLYPSMGVQNDSAGRLWYYTTLTKDITSGERRKTPTEAVRLNNTLLKNELQNFIDRSIKKAKSEDGYENAENRLFYINEDIVRQAESRERSISTDYERQMVSEHLIYYTNPKTGKTDNVKTWQKLHNTVDNHLWDCSVAAMACALMDNVALAQKPTQDKFDEALSILDL